MSDKPIVIVGGGHAGISAAYQFQKKGVPYILLEKANRIGGRAGAVHWDPEHPEYYYSQGAVMTHPDDETCMEYLNELGLGERYVDFGKKKVFGYGDGENLSYIVDDGNFFKALMGLKNMPKRIVPQATKFLMNLGKYTKLIEGENYEKLDEVSNISAWDWAVRDGGDAVADCALGPMIQCMVMGNCHDVSASHPIALLAWMQGMGFIKGSFKVIHDALYEQIKDSTRLGVTVDEIVIEDGAVKGVRLEDGEFIEADHVLCCTDALRARDIMPNAPESIREKLGKNKYSRIMHFCFTFDKRLVPDGFALMMFKVTADSLVSTVLEENLLDLCGPEGTSVLHCYVPDHQVDKMFPLSEEEREQKVRECMGVYFPEFLTEGKCIAQEYFPNGVSLSPSGQMMAMQNLFKELDAGAVKGLRMAGEFGEVFACTEGAFRVGKKQALALMEEIGA